jgi:hypothetical protein
MNAEDEVDAKKILKEAIKTLTETENILQNTMYTLKEQGEQIERINTKISDVAEHIEESKYIVRGMSSFIGSLLNKFIKKNNRSTKSNETKECIKSTANCNTSQCVSKQSTVSETDELHCLIKTLDNINEMSRSMLNEFNIQDVKLDNLLQNIENTTMSTENVTDKMVNLIHNI